MINRIFQKILVTCLILITFNIFANDFKEYNVYLIPAKKAHDYIVKFDNSLKKTNILKQYNVTLFIINHPVHLTLYLTSFQSKHIADIESQLDTIAKNIKSFDIKTTGFSASKSGFVMLDIQNSSYIQKLSDKVITNLSKYRDKDYPMPSWVKYYPSKQQSFKKYGSPNAFAEFTPHLSILAADLQNEKIRVSFEKDFNKVINKIDLKPASFKIKAIGLGEVDKYGQVIKPLHIYRLNS